MRAIWLTWEHQRRNISLSEALGAHYCEINTPGPRFKRYLGNAWKTMAAIRAHRPTHIFYQNPSIALSLLVASVGRLLSPGAKLVGDYHNAGVFPPHGAGLTRWIARRSDMVIVTNSNLVNEVAAWGGRAMAIPDPLPAIHGQPSPAAASQYFDVVFICSWADDEPVGEVIKAGELLLADHPSIRIHITGRPKLQKFFSGDKLPENIHLTGFLSAADFDQRLLDADAVIDLTTRPDCMVCGAYEAISAGAPMVLSDNEPSREYFSRGAVFVDNSAADIARAIKTICAAPAAFRQEVQNLQKEIGQRQSLALATLISMITD